VTGHLIRGGRVLGATGPQRADVRIRNGVVDEVGGDLTPDGDSVVDAAGCWVGPAFVDVHVHLREPGFEHKENIESGSRAAAAGGFSAVVAMPNTSPAMDHPDVVRRVARRGEDIGLVEVLPAAAITKGRAGHVLTDIEALWDAGVRLFSDDGDTVADGGLLRAAMERIAALGGVVSQHAVDPALSGGGHLHEGTVSQRLGIPGIPSAADDVVIDRDLELVRRTGCRYHLQHASTAGAVTMLAAAKAEGLPVTAEVTPHHLAFDHRDVETLDTSFKMMPPLRGPADRDALRRAVAGGVIDMVATDHAPHAPGEKDVPFVDAPNGVLGLEWSAAVVATVLDLDMERFFTRLSIAPAALAGIGDRHGMRVAPGIPANLVVFDPGTETVPRSTRSKSRNSPYLGRRWRGVVRATFYRGTATHRAGGVRG
jgi:dihydroorotase